MSLHRQRRLRRRQDEPGQGAARGRAGACVLSISHTTRPPRPGEVDGRDYHFVDRVRVRAHAEGGRVPGERGDLRQPLRHLAGRHRAGARRGLDVLLEIDWQGAQQVRRLMPQAVGIFILPPSLDALKARLTNRGQDSAEVIARRLAAAEEEISPRVRIRLCYHQRGFRPGGAGSAEHRPGRAASGSPASLPATATCSTAPTRFQRLHMARITVDDCLRVIPNRFDMSLAATYRARQITNGAQPMLEANRDKPTVIALRELAARQVRRGDPEQGTDVAEGGGRRRKEEGSAENPPETSPLSPSALRPSSFMETVPAPTLFKEWSGYLKPEDISQLQSAYHFSEAAHEGQFRKSGEPYISHPLAVANILAQWHLDSAGADRGAAARRDGGHLGHQDRDHAGTSASRSPSWWTASPSSTRSSSRRTRRRRPRTSARCCWRWRATCASS